MNLQITWEQIKKSKPKKVFYSSRTVWWTHDEKDLQPGPVPLDIFGAPLFEMDAKDFLDDALVKACAAYGEDPILTLTLCHHKNIEWLRNHPDFSRDMKYDDVAKILKKGKQVT